MSLSPEQFNDLLKGVGRREKRTIAGEQFISHEVLKNAGLSPYDESSDAALGAGFVTADGYGLEHTPVSGLRSVFGPSGRSLEDVASHKEGVSVIQRHRANQNAPQHPRKPIGLPPSGALARKLGQ